jgi:hypothetical protein
MKIWTWMLTFLLVPFTPTTKVVNFSVDNLPNHNVVIDPLNHQKVIYLSHINNQEDHSTVGWNTIQLEEHKRVKLSFDYIFMPRYNCRMHLIFYNYGHETYHTHFQPTKKWRHVELNYHFIFNATSVGPRFDIDRLQDDITSAWEGHAWIRNVKVTLTP